MRAWLKNRGSRRQPALTSRHPTDFTMKFEPTHAGCHNEKGILRHAGAKAKPRVDRALARPLLTAIYEEAQNQNCQLRPPAPTRPPAGPRRQQRYHVSGLGLQRAAL